jgi:hypothetical protein
MKRALPFLMMLLLVATAGAQPGPLEDDEVGMPMVQQPPRHPVPEDFHLFRYILGNVLRLESVATSLSPALEPAASFERLHEDPKNSVLIVLGDPGWLAGNWIEGSSAAEFKKFVEAGGSVLLATDQPCPKIVADVLKASVPGGPPLLAARDDSYRRIAECPLINDFSHSFIFHEVHDLATNRPSRVVIPAGSPVTVVARFPRSCGVENETPFPFVVTSGRTRAENPSRVLVISDHSVFINRMMMPTDNGNLVFAYNAIRWVTEAESGAPARKKVLLIDDGVVVPTLEVPYKNVSVPTPSLDDLPAHPVDLINTLLAKWEDENVHNELLLNGATWQQILSIAALTMTGLLLAYGFVRIQQAHHPAETGP